MIHLRRKVPARDGSAHGPTRPHTPGTSRSVTGRGKQWGCQRTVPGSSTRVRVRTGETYTDRKCEADCQSDRGRPPATGYEICPRGPRVTTATGPLASYVAGLVLGVPCKSTDKGRNAEWL